MITIESGISKYEIQRIFIESWNHDICLEENKMRLETERLILRD